MPRSKAPIATDLLALSERFSEWRRTHSRRSPLPEELWSEAVKLAHKHGLHRTARSLPVDYPSLQRRMGAGSAGHNKTPPRFVELFAAAPASSGCVVEMLRIETSGAIDWRQFLEAWRRRGA